MIATGGYCPAILDDCGHWNKHQGKCALDERHMENGTTWFCKNNSSSRQIKNKDAYWKIHSNKK